ncbi:MAG: hypothetical protein CR993_01000 [Rhodobacterales bacterium]|nr:MAG: hypothetical protein CR993_01000 [Rhodobacterales bacterium]
MRICFHIGAHETDEDQLVKSLLKNAKTLLAENVAVPGPGRYRPIINQVLDKLRGARASQDTQDVLLEQILDADDTDRLVLSSPYFLSNHPGALRGGRLYPRAGAATLGLRNLFPDNEVEFFIAVRNPATFVPALHMRLQKAPFAEYTAGIDPDTLIWSDVVRDIRAACPDAPVTVWCNEDTPLIWPEVMHRITGISPDIQLKGGFDILSRIMAREGVKRLRAYLGAHPPGTEDQRRRILAAFLDKYALEDEVEEELDLPGWTPELVDHFGDVYDDDMIELSRIDGVRLIEA